MEANFIYFRANFLVNFALKGVKFIKFQKGVLLKIFSPFFQFPHLQSSSGSIQTKLALPVLYAWYCRNRTRLCPQTP